MTSAVPGTDGFAFVLEAVAAHQAITVAERLGVFERLAKGRADRETVARDCNISSRGAAALLAALASLGFVDSDGDGTYALREQPFPLADLRALWSHLEAAVKSGEPRFYGDAPDGAEENYPRIVPRLQAMFAAAAERFAERVVEPGLRVLDLGAGAAPWSLALARRDPSCRVTALDLPSVLEVTRRSVRDAGCGAQFRFVAADLFTADWAERGQDLVILGNVCHLFDPPTNAALLSRVFGALRPSGRVAIVDALVEEGGHDPRSTVLYALGLLLRTRTGRAYPFSSYTAWLQGTGYEAIERTELSESPALALITARRPDRIRG